ncbi:hypothetical protein HHX47_DHR4000125 [Lentinula edodes]|nr:hypothetical protein HHX47_DHR4000125 [Lentinula edodes]
MQRFSRTTVGPKSTRCFTTSKNEIRRSYLYVPSSSDKLLEKSLTVKSDIIIYDLEDSVSPAPADKKDARDRLRTFLKRKDVPQAERVAIRLNDISTPFFQQDITHILQSPSVQTLILPKIHSAQDLHYVSRHIHQISQKHPHETPLRIVPSIESARALWNLGAIAGWQSEHGALQGGAFAAEDYCADTSIIRTRSRQELLYTRSQIAIAAKAFGLEAIDMQAIHPAQVETIQNTFVPTAEEILRAAKILRGMQVAHASQKGAIGLDGEMIDAPMIKQVNLYYSSFITRITLIISIIQATKIVEIAKEAGIEIPQID